MSDFNHNTEDFSDNFNFKETIYPYLFKWKWYLVTLAIGVIFGLLYLRYTIPTYNVSASILIKDDDKNDLVSQMSAVSELSGGGSIQNKIKNEIEILESRKLLSRVVKDLKLNINYIDNNGHISKEQFLNPWVRINFLKGDSSIYDFKGIFEITFISNSTFEIMDVETEKTRKLNFGTSFNLPLGDAVITPNCREIPIGKKLIIDVTKFDAVVDYLQNNVTIEENNKESSVLLISMDIDNIEKGEAIVNNIIKQHNKDAIQDKNEVSKNTLNFINERITFITNELSDVDENVSNFKSNNKIFDLTTNASLFFENESENEKLIVENGTQLKMAEYIYEYISNKKNGELIPSNIGINNPSIEKMIETVNTLQLERNKLIIGSSEKNPVIINLDTQLESLKRNLKESLSNQSNSLKIRNKSLENQDKNLKNKLVSAPVQEKNFKEIMRQQQIKENLYLFLLQKREETSMALAVTVSNSKTIDDAYSDGSIIKPKKKMVFSIVFLITIAITTLIIYIRNTLDTKIHNKFDISDLGIPYIGDIPISDNPNKLVVGKHERTSIAEAFRLLRTNLNFLITTKKEECKSIFITSTISHEGKSFIALNLASTLGLSGKKVALIGMDLRAPKIMQYLDKNVTKGVTSYIIDENITVDDISVQLPEISNVTIIPSGPIPPNPAELLMNDRLIELFKIVKDKFDYIVVDTAPVGMVADTLLLNDYADIFLYVSRADYLDKRLLHIPTTLYKEGKLKNMAILLNCSDHTKNYGYGYGYGYGDGVIQTNIRNKTWFEKIKNKI